MTSRGVRERRRSRPRTSPAATDSTWPNARGWTIAGRALAILVFVVYAALAILYHPVGDYFTESDFFEYMRGVMAMRAGHVDAGRYAVVGPVYETLLAVGSFITSDLFRLATLLSAIAAALTVLAWSEIVRWRMHPMAGFTTALFLAANPTFCRYGYSATTDLVAMCMQALSLWALFVGGGAAASDARATRTPSWPAPFVAGALAALATLTRYNAVALVPGAVAYLVWLARRDPALRLRGSAGLRWRLAAAYLAGFAVLFVPWFVFSAAAGHLPAESLFRNYAFYSSTETAARNVQDTLAAAAPGATAGGGFRPFAVLARLFANVPDDLARDAKELLRLPVAIACVASFAVVVRAGLWPALLPLAVQGAMIFGVLATVFYSDRYALPLAPIYLASLGAAVAAGAFWQRRRIPTWLPVVAVIVPLAFSMRESIALQRFVREQLPVEVKPAAAALRCAALAANATDAAVIARKAAVAHYAGVRSVAFPRLRTLAELAEYARQNRADYVYFSWYEGELRPEFWFLLDSTAAVPGLERLFMTTATPSILYRIRPAFGATPAWFANDTLKRIHDMRGYVRIVRDAEAYPLHRSLGASAARDGDWATAVDHFRAMTIGRPSGIEGWLMLGEAELERGTFAAALAAFATAQRLEPRNPAARLGGGLAEFGLGRVDAAATMLKPVLARVRDARTLAALDSAYAARGDEAARAELARVRGLNP